MKNSHQWIETKAVRKGRSFIPSSDTNVVGIDSRVAVSCQIPHYENAIREHARGRLLDLGCGHVPYYEMYHGLVTETVCLDWENTLHKNELLDAVVDLNGPLPMECDCFDTVLLMDVLEHIARPADLIREISRVLRPGGKLIGGVPFFYRLHEQPHDFYRYTEFALAGMCESNGLDVVSLVPYGGVPEILVDISGKCISATSKLLGQVYVAACKITLALPPIQSISRCTSKLFPFGYTLVAGKRV